MFRRNVQSNIGYNKYKHQNIKAKAKEKVWPGDGICMKPLQGTTMTIEIIKL